MTGTTPMAPGEASWLQTRAIVRIIFIVLAVAAVLWLLHALIGVLLLLVLAIFFAYLVAPLVEFGCRSFSVRGRTRILPRALAIGGVYLLIFGSFGIGGFLLLPQLGTQVAQFAQQAPTYLESVRAWAVGWTSYYEQYRLPAGVREAINNRVTLATELVLQYATEGAGSALVRALGYLPWLILIPILAFFLLRDAPSFRASALQLLPRGRWRSRGREFLQELDRTLALYVRAQLIACVLIGIVCSIGFSLIGLRYALLVGTMAGVLEFIPLVGPFTVALVALFIAGFYSMKQALAVVIFLGVLRVVQDYVIYPRIIGHGTHLHPLAVIVAILVGAELAGVVGVFLAIPMAGILSVCYRHWREPGGGEDPPIPLPSAAEVCASQSAWPRRR
jgi:predicted PurR-regulated permease PerM